MREVVFDIQALDDLKFWIKNIKVMSIICRLYQIAKSGMFLFLLPYFQGLFWKKMVTFHNWTRMHWWPKAPYHRWKKVFGRS